MTKLTLRCSSRLPLLTLALLSISALGITGCDPGTGIGTGNENDNATTNDNDNATDNDNDNGTDNDNDNGTDNANDNGTDTSGFDNADANRGGALYDKWWTVAGVDSPTDDNPLWATRPDTESNTRTGSDTWRCKECHGWDYKGFAGAYSSGSHVTGFDGIFGTTATAQEVFDSLSTTHAFDTTGLTEADLWDLVKFALEGTIDTDEVLDAGAFTGIADDGMATFDTNCAACHGADGLTLPPGADTDFDAYVGYLSNDNPAEFQHKVRFGQPGTAMPQLADALTLDDLANLGAYSQSLPTEPAAGEPDPALGEAFYADNGCTPCHGASAEGVVGPSLVGAAAADLLGKIDGTDTHGGGTVDGVTPEDADNLEAWLATLGGG